MQLQEACRQRQGGSGLKVKGRVEVEGLVAVVPAHEAVAGLGGAVRVGRWVCGLRAIQDCLDGETVEHVAVLVGKGHRVGSVDGGRGGGLLSFGGQHVVSGIPAAERQAADANCLALASLGIGKRARGRDGEHVALHFSRQFGFGHVERSLRVAVGHLVLRRDAAHGDGLR